VVRVWEEPRETPHSAATVRGYVRNLTTGEERSMSDASLMLRLLAGDEGEDSSRPADVGDEPCWPPGEAGG
jgi:hypothetical protein